MKAIWARDPAEVPEEEFKEFYKHIAHDWNDPLKRISFKIEGTLEYRGLLFIPSVAPFDLFLREGHRGVHLYIKRVFILDECKDLIPEYLRFVRGVVDSEDLSLNISREILQQNRQIQRMRKGLTKKVLDTLKGMKDSEEESYRKFWRELGRVLKEGIYQDLENRQSILDLVLCESTREDGALTDLRSYVGRMKEGQEAIYFLCGESAKAVRSSPHIEALLDRGHEVLIFTDPIDEFWTEQVQDFEGKKLQSALKGDVAIGGEAEKKARDDKARSFADVLEYLKHKLSDYVKEVRLSSRLKSSPACLVGDPGDISPQLEALLRATHQKAPSQKRILEVNGEHPIVARMQALFSKDRSSAALADYAFLVHNQALIAEGGRPTDPPRFSRLVAELMVRASES
jgi:molecular chaperone HtpG